MRFVDFQISRLGSPILDFAYFFYTSSPKNIMANVDKYLEIYHGSFSSFLTELGSDPEKLFSLSLLKEHWRKYSQFGLVMSVVLFTFMLKGDGEPVSITENEFYKAFVTPIKNQELCDQRAIDVIAHFADKNLI